MWRTLVTGRNSPQSIAGSHVLTNNVDEAVYVATGALLHTEAAGRIRTHSKEAIAMSILHMATVRATSLVGKTTEVGRNAAEVGDNREGRVR